MEGFDFGGAFGGSGSGYDFGSTSSSAQGGNTQTYYRSQLASGDNTLLIIGAALVAFVVYLRLK